jgi:acyl-CoA synthetase (AMP-forming)/AMP-acid ligase II
MSQIQISTFAELLVPDFGSKTAIVVPETTPDGGQTLTYAGLRQQVESLSRSMAADGVRPGDLSVLLLPNGAEFLISFLALNALGAAALPVNPACTLQELSFALKDSGARFVIAKESDQAAVPALASSGARWAEVTMDQDLNVKVSFVSAISTPAVPVSADDLLDVAMIIYTSGTTSRPKAVPLTRKNIAMSIHNFSEWFKLSPEDTTLVVMPPFHVHGLVGATLATLHSGGCAVIPPRFSASRFWQYVLRYGVTWYTASPTIHQILLKRADEDRAPAGKLRFVRSSSARMPAAVMSQFESRFATTMIEAYGMTEAANQISANPLPPLQRKTGSVGLPAGTEVAVLDKHDRPLPAGQVGEIVIRGEAVLEGYRNNADANSKSFIRGWFRTGDQGYVDGNGYLYVSGRIKDLINRGGEKISPVEIESVLLEHPAVAEAVCFGVPDEIYGEEVQAAVVLQAEADPQAILLFCRSRLAEYKVPKKIHPAKEFPRNATNKIRRQVVAQMFASQE